MSMAGTETPVYTVQAQDPYLHRYPHHAHFGYGPPVATRLNRSGSDCGSSSGLGGMKDPPSVGENNSDDSGSNHDGASSNADEIPSEEKALRSSSKQSAASSSGKGSSTGTSPTGAAKLRSPKRAVHHHHHHHHHYRNSQHTSLPSTSSAGATSPSEAVVSSAGDGSTPSASLLNGSGGEFGPATGATFHRPHELPLAAHQPLVAQQLIVTSMAPHGSAGTLVPPPPLYTMTVGAPGHFEVLNPVAPMVRQQMTRSNTSSPYSPTPAGAPPANGPHPPSGAGGGSGPGSVQGSRNSTSPPTLNGNTAATCASGIAPSPQHAVFVHVHAGETLSVRVGNEVQQIHGPATVRMVSQNSVPPFPLPLHVPMGTVVQQIVDENGILRHLILSPQSAVGPMTNGPFTAPGTFPSHPGGPAAGPPPPPQALAGSPGPALPFMVPAGSNTPPPNLYTPYGVPPGAPIVAPTMAIPDQYEFQTNEVQHGLFPAVIPSKIRAPRHKPGVIEDGFVNEGMEVNDNSRDDSRSGTSAADDEESEKIREMLGIKEMLSKIQPVQVCEVGPRDALIQWQMLDTSEASACGGPFPQIDASEFAYELMLCEGKPEGKPTTSYRCSADQTPPQLRLCHLSPNCDYFVRLRASLPERSLHGNPSAPVGYTTKPSHPDKPYPPRLQKRGKTWFQLQWKRPCDNGAKITNYQLEIDEAREDRPAEYREAYEGSQDQCRVSKLEPNTLYRLRLAASNLHGMSEFSDILMVQTNGAPPTAPEPPQLLHATSSSLQLAWQKRAGDDQFTLQMEDPSSGHGYLNASVTPETVTTVHGLHRNCQYNFRMIAQNDDGKSPCSEAVSYNTLPCKPQAPAKPYLKDRVKSNSVRLAWDIPRDTGGAPISSYQLEYCIDPSSPNVATIPEDWSDVYSGEERECTVSQLEPGCGYQFKVCCFGPAGQSQYSDPLQVTTTCVPPGQCPRPELVGKTKPNSISLKWGIPTSTGGSEITDFELFMCGESVFKGPKCDFQAVNLSPGNSYRFKVRAQNLAGSGHWSEELETETAPGAPDAPGRPSCSSITATSLILCWEEPPSSNGAVISEYRLLKAVTRLVSLKVPAVLVEGKDENDRSTPSTPTSPNVDSEFGEFVQVYAGANQNHEVRTLSPATDYAFKVQAVNCAGASVPSVTFVCRTPPGAPEPPARVVVEPLSTNGVQISWQEPSDNGSPLNGYLIEMDRVDNEDEETLSEPIQIPAHITEHVVDSLTPETSYKVRVQALNEIGSSDWSNLVKVITFSRPPPPPCLELLSATHNSLKVKWQDTKQPANSESYNYNLEVENRSGSFSPVYEGPSRSHKVLRLVENCGYGFRIRAVSSSGGVGSWSDAVTFRTCLAPPPSIKGSPRVTEACGGSWQVEWVGVKTSGLPLTDKIHYCLQLSASSRNSSNDQWKTVYQGPSQSYTLSSLPVSCSCRVRVMPVRISQVSEEDKSNTAETFGQPVTSAPFSTQPPNSRRSSEEPVSSENVSVSAGETPTDTTAGPVGMSDRHWAALILAGFSFIAILLAVLVQWFLMDN